MRGAGSTLAAAWARRSAAKLRSPTSLLLSVRTLHSASPAAESWSQPWIQLAKNFLLARALTLSAGAVCTTGGALFFAYSYSEAGVARHMCRVFEAGGLPGWDLPFRGDRSPNMIPRTQLQADLAKMMQPGGTTRYAVVVGAAGTGKSTAVRKAVRDLEPPWGAVYFLPPTLVAGFSPALAEALGFYRPLRWADRLVRLFSGEIKEAAAPPPASEPHATWRTLEPFIIKAAARYVDKHGVAPVLVLDAMENVAKDDPAFFLKVQDLAKKCADMKILRVVLVFSDGRALPLLQSSSAITRASDIYEVGDVSDKEAAVWLESEYKVEPERAAEIVDTVAGGRFPLLAMCGESSRPLAAISHELDDQTRVHLQRAGVGASDPLIAALLSAGRIDQDRAHELLSELKTMELLSANILSAHPDRTYSFHDRHVARFFRASHDTGHQQHQGVLVPRILRARQRGCLLRLLRKDSMRADRSGLSRPVPHLH